MPSPDPTGLRPPRALGAFGGLRCDDAVIIHRTVQQAGEKARPEPLRGTLACWWCVSPTRQHWLVRVPTAHGHVEMASILVEEDDTGRVLLVGGDRLGQGIATAETIATGKESHRPIGEDLLLLATCVLAFAGNLHTDTPQAVPQVVPE